MDAALAVPFSLRAAQRSLELAREAVYAGRYAQAIQFASEALDLLDSVSPSPERERMRYDLLLERGRARVLAGDYGALSDFQKVRGESPNSLQRTEALVGIADCHNGLGDYSLAEQEYRLAEQESIADRQDLNLIRARIGLGVLYWKQGRIEDAIRVLRQARTDLQRAPDVYELGRVMINLGIAYDYAGQLDQAIEAYEEALKCFRALGNDHRAAAVLNNIGELFQELRDLERALSYHEEAAKLADQVGADRISVDVTRNIGVDLLLLGRYSEAMMCLNQALARAREMRDKDLILQALFSLGDAFLRQGEVQRALAVASELAAEATAVGSELHLARAKWLQGRAYLAQGERDRAQQILQEALGDAHALPSRSLIWQLHATLGRTTEDPQLAQVHFRIAADFIRQTVDTLKDSNLRNLFLSQPEVQAVLQRVDET